MLDDRDTKQLEPIEMTQPKIDLLKLANQLNESPPEKTNKQFATVVVKDVFDEDLELTG